VEILAEGMFFKNIAHSIEILCLAILLLVSCGKQGGKWKGTISEEGGITVVKNPKEPIWSTDILKLEEEVSIGEKEGGREELLFSRVREIDADVKGNIYVLDSQPPFVRVSDESGAFERTIGQKGQGPGEMEGPACLQITPAEEVMVYDYLTRRLIFFSLKGLYLRQSSTATVTPFTYLKMDSRGNYVADLLLPPPAGQEVAKFSSDMKPIATIAKIESHYKDREIDVLAPTILFDLTPGGDLVWARSDSYIMYILDPAGRVIKRIQKEYEAYDVTEEYKKSITQRFMGLDSSRQTWKLNFAKSFPPMRGLYVDEEGRIFVETYEPVLGRKGWTCFDVFDSEGRFMAKFPIKRSGSQQYIWKNGCLYRVEQDEEGYQKVVRYRVTWQVPAIS
jgi:hypothetical protein